MNPRTLGALLTAAWLITGCGLVRAGPSDPLTADEHNELGVAYYARGEYALAVREFRRAAALRRGWTRALANLGDAHRAVGDLDAAIDAYEAGLRASPGDSPTANNLAWTLLQHPGRWREAEPVIRGALARDPEPRGYYLDTLGLLLLRKGEPLGALEAFRAALADAGLQDRTTRALVLRHTGEAHASLGDLAAAERCHRLARDLTGAGAAATESEAVRGRLQDSAIGGTDPVC